MSVLWSILIPSIPSRKKKLDRITAQLTEQCMKLFPRPYFWADSPVQLLVHTTPSIADGGPSVGEKRNILLANAEGEYVSFVDDDDILRDDYVETIYHALNNGPPLDLLTFQVEVHSHGGRALPCHYGLGFRENKNLPDGYERRPNHLMVWRRSLCVEFEKKSMGEDTDWGEAMLYQAIPLRWRDIPKILYEYRFNRFDSVTAGTAR